MPKSLQGSVVWGWEFYDWVLHCVKLRLFTIITCLVVVVDTIMCWLMSQY